MDARVLNNVCRGLEGHEGNKILKPIVIKLLLHPFLGTPQPSCRGRFLPQCVKALLLHTLETLWDPFP